MKDDKIAWTSCSTYGIRWFDPKKPNTYPIPCRNIKCKHCTADRTANKLWETMEYEMLFNNQNKEL